MSRHGKRRRTGPDEDVSAVSHASSAPARAVSGDGTGGFAEAFEPGPGPAFPGGPAGPFTDGADETPGPFRPSGTAQVPEPPGPSRFSYDELTGGDDDASGARATAGPEGDGGAHGGAEGGGDGGGSWTDGRWTGGRRPSPPPLEADDVKIVAGGTVVWFALFVVAFVMRDRLERDGHGWWPWCALAGAGLGLLGVYYCRHRREGLRAREAAAPRGGS